MDNQRAGKVGIRDNVQDEPGKCGSASLCRPFISGDISCSGLAVFQDPEKLLSRNLKFLVPFCSDHDIVWDVVHPDIASPAKKSQMISGQSDSKTKPSAVPRWNQQVQIHVYHQGLQINDFLGI
ncbi:hypothetical protein BASA83_013380 [Batrachochytrium salamandrivorans]|nr:hypothetical protein BASA83_013380 [Batrachochytrium salamandrivorans]